MISLLPLSPPRGLLDNKCLQLVFISFPAAALLWDVSLKLIYFQKCHMQTLIVEEAWWALFKHRKLAPM